MKKSNNQQGYNRGYARLAEAILNDGIKSNDKVFIDSDWFKFLKDFVSLDYKLFENNSDNHNCVYHVRG